MKIRVVKNVMEASDAQARVNRQRFSEAGVLAVNILSAPGSGKTTLLQKTLPALAADGRCAVLVGDLQTTRDAERLADLGAQVVQINTGRGCHLTPAEVSEGFAALEDQNVGYLFIENVGNMVCPAGFDLGEHARAVLLSLPEGDDKVAKYPLLFQHADVVLLTKMDLLGVLEGYQRHRPAQDIAQIKAGVPFIELSVRTGEGFEAWLAWLRQMRRDCLAGGPGGAGRPLGGGNF